MPAGAPTVRESPRLRRARQRLDRAGAPGYAAGSVTRSLRFAAVESGLKRESLGGTRRRRRNARRGEDDEMPDTEYRAGSDEAPRLEGDDAAQADDEVANPDRFAITSYGWAMQTDEAIGRLERGDIDVPDLPRHYVWTRGQASRFVESLVLGLPVPGIFLFQESGTKRLMVVDGQQRLKTLQLFYSGRFHDERTFRLVGVSEEFDGKSYKELSILDRRRLDNSLLHATIFHRVGPGNDRILIYSMFERLNTGGTALAPQEIRSFVYCGNFNNLLRELAENADWRELYGNRSANKKDEEIILRFFALYFNIDAYRRPMKRFLNDFMDENRELSGGQEQEFRGLFLRTVATAARVLTRSAFRPARAFNVSVADAALVGLAHRLERGEIRDPDSLRRRHCVLLARLRAEDLHTRGTVEKERIAKRIGYARESYGNVS